ncbi:MAG: hypothetical protein ACREJ2_11880, partial [Planctomycetota bacterium]
MSVNSAATASAPGCDAGARWTAGLAQADGSVFAPAPWSVWWTLAADLPAPIASAPSGVTVLFQPVALEQFPAWLAAETARLRRAGDSLPTGPAGAAGAAGP